MTTIVKTSEHANKGLDEVGVDGGKVSLTVMDGER